MSQASPQEDITKKRVVYHAPGMERVQTRHDVEYQSGDAGALTMDLYYPPDWQDGVRAPAVVIVAGYSDFRKPSYFSCKFKELEWTISWGQLLASSGMVAITYSTLEPVSDLRTLLQYTRQNAEALGIDERKIGLWGASGNAPNALSVLMQDRSIGIKVAVLCCAFTLDLDSSTVVAQAAKAYGFVNPCAGKSIDDIPRDTPMLIVRAGQDQFPGLNDSMDRFVTKALGRNLPITLLNHPSGPHAFDLYEDNENSRQVIKRILAYTRESTSA